MKKIGISTVHTGYNYGSLLQCYATKIFLKELGYEPIVISEGGTLVKGRDVRIKKIIFMGLRLLRHPTSIKKQISVYSGNMNFELSENTKTNFREFEDVYIQSELLSWSKMKKIAKKEEYVAFLCGSDQVWNGDALYVDPQYYLRYAPKYKRIAFSPSFGRNYVNQYNEKIISRYIKDIPHLSIREESGVKIINKMTGQKAIHLLDPTLLVNKYVWLKITNINITKSNNYLLTYFLNEPSDYAKKFMLDLAREKKLKIISIPYIKNEKWINYNPDTGPIQFLELINNASFVCTDSFHGTVFSINFETPFFTFDRQYGSANKQSSRIESILKLCSFENKFNPSINDKFLFDFNFENSNNVLDKERDKARQYLKRSLANCENNYK